MNRMFSGCSNLKTLNVLSFNIYKSIDNNYMFCNCINLNIDRKFFNNKVFICCENEIPYYIEEKIYV